MSRPDDTRTIAITVFDAFQSLDAVGPAEVFWTAGRLSGEPYEVKIVAAHAGTVTTGSGLRIEPHGTLQGLRGPIDTLIVAGGFGTVEAERDDTLIRGVRQAATRSRRIASVCTGSFILARAGLLDGRRATTHWASCELLATRHPSIEVESDSIFVRDGDVWTSAGVTAGMDLALAMVEADLGRELALDVARWLVLFVQRPGGQSQFSAQLSAQAAEHEPVRDLQTWIADNLGADLTVDALAQRANMSPRNFARVFRREVGMTPAAYVEALRVERAQRELETTKAALDTIARRCGFGSTDTMRRAFRRKVGISPIDYRARFRPALERVA
jgi:transcriptional regulator GlxA family with amidase domain